MRAAIAVLSILLLIAGCARPLPPLETPAPILSITEARPSDETQAPFLFISNALQSDAQLCVTRQLFRSEGAACITVGELRALLRSRGAVAAHGVDR